MPTFSANRILPQPSQAAAVGVRVTFGAAQQVPQPAQVVTLVPENFPDPHFRAAQQVPPDRQRVVLVPATWRGPAEPRPPGVPALPRP